MGKNQCLLNGESGFPDVTGCTHTRWQATELVLICGPFPVTGARWTWGSSSAHWICPVAHGEPVRGMGAAVSPSKQTPFEGSQHDSSQAPLEAGVWGSLFHGRACHGGKSFGVQATPDSVLLRRTSSKNPDKGSSKTVHELGTPESHVRKCTPLEITGDLYKEVSGMMVVRKQTWTLPQMQSRQGCLSVFFSPLNKAHCF